MGEATAGPPSAPVAHPRDDVQVRYTLTTRDLWNAGLATARYSILANALGSALILSGIFSLVATGDRFGIVIALAGVALMSGIGISLLTVVLARGRPSAHREPIDLTVSSAGIRSVMPSMTGEAAWSSYKRIRITKATLLLELGTGAAVVIPGRAFDERQLDWVRTWAAAAGVLDVSSGLRPLLIGAVLGVAFNGVIFFAVVLGSQ